MRADSRATDVIRAIVSVVRARGAVHLMVIQAHAGTDAGIRVSAIIVSGITAGRSDDQIRMRADPRAADVIRAIVSVVRAGRTVRLVIVEAYSGAVARIRVCAVTVGGITARGTGR